MSHPCPNLWIFRWPSNSWLSVEILWDFHIPIYCFESTCAHHQIYSNTHPPNEAKPLIHGSHRWLFWNLAKQNITCQNSTWTGFHCKKRSLSKSGFGGDRIITLLTYLDLGRMLRHFSTLSTTCQAPAPVAFLALRLWPATSKVTWHPKCFTSFSL